MPPRLVHGGNALRLNATVRWWSILDVRLHGVHHGHQLMIPPHLVDQVSTKSRLTRVQSERPGRSACRRGCSHGCPASCELPRAAGRAAIVLRLRECRVARSRRRPNTGRPLSWRRARDTFDRLTGHPDQKRVSVLRIPESQQSPAVSIGRWLVGAALALSLTVLLVYLDRHGYRDANEDGLSLLDCIYYATVSLSHNRIRRHHAGQRLCPAGERPGHHSVAGAVPCRAGQDHPLEEPVAVVVVDTDPSAREAVNARGLVTVNGNGTRSEVLRLAGVARAVAW